MLNGDAVAAISVVVVAAAAAAEDTVAAGDTGLGVAENAAAVNTMSKSSWLHKSC